MEGPKQSQIDAACEEHARAHGEAAGRLRHLKEIYAHKCDDMRHSLLTHVRVLSGRILSDALDDTNDIEMAFDNANQELGDALEKLADCCEVSAEPLDATHAYNIWEKHDGYTGQ